MIFRTQKLNTANRYLAPFIIAASLSALTRPVSAQTAAPPTTDLGQPLVTIGSTTIDKGDYEAKLEATAGKAVLQKIVFSALVRQAAAKAGVMPTDKDVDARIAQLQRANPQQALLVSTPEGRDDLITDLALENLRIQGRTASDAEIVKYYAAHKAQLTLPAQSQTVMVVSQSIVDSRRAESLLGDHATPEDIASRPGLHVAGVNGFNVNLAALPPAVGKQIQQAVLAMKPGQIQTVPVGNQLFLTFFIKSATPASLPPLSQIKGEIARQIKLQKAISPQQELTLLYAANPPVFSDDRYKSYFSDVQGPPNAAQPAGGVTK